MAIPRYKGIESIAKITSWFLKHDHTITNKLWEHPEARNELNNWLTLLFQNQQQSAINENMNVLFHEFTYLSLPQLEEWRQKNILNSEEQEAYHKLLTLVVFQNAQLRISGWIYQQQFKKEFSPFGNPFQILGYFDGFIDYYRVLGLPSTCTAEDIKKAYRAKAKILHPDTGGDAEAFKQLKEAYDVLSDEQQRNVFHEKYEFYQNRYDYDIKATAMENQSTYNAQSERPRFVIRFSWKAFLTVISCFLIFGIISSFLTDLNHKTVSTDTPFATQSSNSIAEQENSNSKQTSSSAGSSDNQASTQLIPPDYSIYNGDWTDSNDYCGNGYFLTLQFTDKNTAKVLTGAIMYGTKAVRCENIKPDSGEDAVVTFDQNGVGTYTFLDGRDGVTQIQATLKLAGNKVIFTTKQLNHPQLGDSEFWDNHTTDLPYHNKNITTTSNQSSQQARYSTTDLQNLFNKVISDSKGGILNISYVQQGDTIEVDVRMPETGWDGLNNTDKKSMVEQLGKGIQIAD